MGCEQYIDLFIATNARHIFSISDNILQDNTKIKEPCLIQCYQCKNYSFFCTVEQYWL